MPRTPSMTRHTAEAMIGPRNALLVTGETRNLLRKWLTASGADSRAVYRMTTAQLANTYMTYGPGAADYDNLGSFIRESIGTLTVKPIASAPVGTTEDAAAKAFVEAIRLLTNNPGAIPDEKRIREIVGEMLDTLAPRETINVLEVRTPTTVARIDGIIHGLTPEIIKIAALAHPIMLVGPAGCGKTTVGEHVAKALSLPFYITSTVFDTHELLGFVDGFGKYHNTPFRQAFEHGGVWIADEIDAWDAAALLAMNSALANGFVTFPDSEKPVRRHANFRLIATANTYGHGADRVYVGRNELDAASLDRFATFDIDYDDNVETYLSGGNMKWLAYVRSIRNAVRAKNIRHVVSTRAIMNGAAALAAGVDFERVKSLYVFKGMSATDRAKLPA